MRTDTYQSCQNASQDGVVGRVEALVESAATLLNSYNNNNNNLPKVFALCPSRDDSPASQGGSNS